MTSRRFNLQKRKQQKRRQLMIRQKIDALLLILAGIVSIPACGNDGTFALLIVPIGVHLLFTRKCWIM